MQIKALEAAVLIMGCTGIGLWKWARLYARVKELRDLREILQRLRVEILYEQTPLEEAALHLTQERDNGFFQMLWDGHLQGRWEDYAQLWEDTCEQWFPTSLLKSEEREAWVRLGRQLGRGGLKQQEQVLDHCEFQLKDLEEQALSDLKTRGRMYITMGICCGIFLTVLLL